MRYREHDWKNSNGFEMYRQKDVPDKARNEQPNIKKNKCKWGQSVDLGAVR